MAVVAKAVALHGRLDCAVNAAGIEFETVPLAECADDDFDRMMNVNTKGVFLSMKYELRAMIKAGNGGSIVNIASTNSFRPQHNQPAYTASKHAVLGLTRSAAIDYARKNIRVNCVVPGAINTPMLHAVTEQPTTSPAASASSAASVSPARSPTPSCSCAATRPRSQQATPCRSMAACSPDSNWYLGSDPQ